MFKKKKELGKYKQDKLTLLLMIAVYFIQNLSKRQTTDHHDASLIAKMAAGCFHIHAHTGLRIRSAHIKLAMTLNVQISVKQLLLISQKCSE